MNWLIALLKGSLKTLRKLRSALKNPILQLTLKSLIFGLFLAWFWSGGHWFSGFLAILSALIFHFSPIFNNRQFLASFLVFLVISLFGFKFVFSVSGYYPLFAVIFGGFFFFLLGIKNFIFVNRNLIYYFLNNALFLAVFLAFFLANKSNWFFLKYLFVFGAIFLIFREFMVFFEKTAENSGFFKPSVLKIDLISLVSAFLMSQFAWTVALLPIGFLNASALLILLVLIVKDLAINHISGALNRHSVLKNITILLIFSLIIFAASRWSPSF